MASSLDERSRKLEVLLNFVLAVSKFFGVKNASEEHIMPRALASFLNVHVQSLEALLNSEARFTGSKTYQFQTLREELNFLITFLEDTPFLHPEHHQNVKDLLIDIQALADKVASLMYLFLLKRLDNRFSVVAREMNDALFGIFQHIEITKAAVRKYVEVGLPMPRRSKTSNTDDFVGAFVDSLLENLKELLHHKADTIVPLIDQITVTREELELLKSFLVNSRERRAELGDIHLKDVAARIGDISRETEYVIDSFVVKGERGPDWYFTSRLSNVVKELKLVRRETMQIDHAKMCKIGVHKVSEIFRGSSKASVSVVEDNVVGFDDKASTIIELLIGNHPAHLEVISIVGMAGIGKTTLAKKIYNDPYITYHFYRRSWCCVSPVYQKRDLLLDLLSSVTKLTEQINNMSDELIAHKLHKCLMGQRYLIVIDDVWSPEVWKDLRRSFPDNKNGSRILLTSRLNDVALKVKPDSTPLELPFLTEDECWNLLQEKAFPKEVCPPELVGVGKQVAGNCHLP